MAEMVYSCHPVNYDVNSRLECLFVAYSFPICNLGEHFASLFMRNVNYPHILALYQSSLGPRKANKIKLLFFV